MPHSREALDLTNRYRSTLLTTRQRATLIAASSWRNLDLRDLDGSYRAWRGLMVQLVRGVKRQGVALSDAYLASFVAAELGTRPLTQGVDPETYVDTIDGRPLDQALSPPLFTVKLALAQGRQNALDLGLSRATRIVSEEVLGAPRRALGDLMATEDRVEGWKRVTGPGPCGACLAAADGHVHDPTYPFRRHTACRCVQEPVVQGVTDTFRRPTGREVFDSLTPEGQNALFHGRGGAGKAERIRSGAVPLEALAKRDAQAVTPDQFTEAPLRELTNRPGDSGPEH